MSLNQLKQKLQSKIATFRRTLNNNNWLDKKKGGLLLVLIMGIIAAYFLMRSGTVYGVGTDWIQTEWSETSTSSYPAYPADRTGWTQFYSKDLHVGTGTSASLTASSTLFTRNTTLPQGMVDTCVSYDETTDKFYLFGGYWMDDNNESQYSSTTIQYDADQDQISTSSIGNLPVELRGHGCGRASSTAIYIFGGYDNTNGSFNNTIYKFDPSNPSTDVTSTGISIGQGRKDMGVAYAPNTNRFYLFGGYYLDDSNSSHYLDKIVEFDPSTGATSTVATLYSSLRGVTATYYPKEEAIYIFGGADSNGSFNADIYKFYPASNTFTDIDHDLNQGREFIASSFYDSFLDKIYLFGGYYLNTLGNSVFSNKIVNFSTSSKNSIQSETVFSSGGLKKASAAYSSEKEAIFIFGGHNETDYSDKILAYPLVQKLISSPFNTTDPSGSLSSISWNESLPGSSDVRVQMRTAGNNNNNTPGDRSDDEPTNYSNWCGPDDADSATSTCSTSTYFTDPNGNEAIDEMFTDGANDQWVQYSLTFSRETTTNEPSLSEITLAYDINSEPTVANASSSQNATGTVNTSYDYSDAEQSSVNSSLFYDAGISLNGSSTVHATSVSVTDPNGVLSLIATSSNYVLQLEGEQLSCSTTDATTDTFSDCTRAFNGTSFYQISHASGTTVWIKANSVENAGSITATTSTSTKTIEWSAKDDIDEFYSSSAQVRVNLNDQASAWSIGYDDATLELDTENPTSSVGSLSSWQTDSSWTVTWSGGDAGTGIATYDVQYRKDGGGWYTCVSATSSTSLTFPKACPEGYPTVTEGAEFGFRVRALDNSGNQEKYPATADATTKADIENPESSIGSPEAGSWQTSDFVVGIGDVDDGSGLASCEYRIDDGNDGTYDPNWTTKGCSKGLKVTVGSVADCSVQGENECRIEIRATDNAGKVATATRKFSIDYTEPSGGSVNYEDGLSTSSAITVSLDDGSDNGSGIDQTSRRLERRKASLAQGSCGPPGEWQLIAIDTGVDYSDHTDNDVSAPACYQYRYLVSDKAGHQVTYSTTSTTTLDVARPTGLEALHISTVSTSSATLSWGEVSSGYFNQYVVWYGQNKSEVLSRTNVSSTTISSKSNTSVVINNLNSQTTYYFKVWAQDTRNNESTVPALKAETLSYNYQQLEGVEVEGVEVE